MSIDPKQFSNTPTAAPAAPTGKLAPEALRCAKPAEQRQQPVTPTTKGV